MFKSFGVIIVGVFVGAILTDILHMKKPYALEGVRRKGRGIVKGLDKEISKKEDNKETKQDG